MTHHIIKPDLIHKALNTFASDERKLKFAPACIGAILALFYT